MSRKRSIPERLWRISQPWKQAWLLLALAETELEPCSSPSILSPKDSFFAWEMRRAMWSIGRRGSLNLCFCSQRIEERQTRYHCCLVAMASLYIGALQTGVSVKRHLSRIFPAHPRSLASVLVPRPAAHRCSASHCVRPAGLGFQTKNLPAAAAQSTGEIFSSEPPQKAHLGTWERGTSRRFAQECPEGIPGKYKQEK